MYSKKVSKWVLFSVAIMSILFTPVLTAQAQNVIPAGSGTITPYWTHIESAQANISVSNKVLKPSTYITAQSTTARISGTMYLEKKSGSSWSTVTSWSISGTGYIATSKSYTGTAGTVYRARVVASVNGESVECTSSECEA